ncbi:MAG: dUTPase [Puniceicoccales bacterium]|jgi:dimeric dUTPase (all-alpha-NTP-PPase superfamily)|nr:dUTPase [Puniceicoccales bacterium]
MDKLDHMFEMQTALTGRIGIDSENLDENGKIEWILNYSRAMQQELSELVDSVPWKWWAKYQVFNEQNARVEIIDLFHFLIAMAQVLGLNSDDIYNIYCKKNKINHQRQDSGYINKDEHDSENI